LSPLHRVYQDTHTHTHTIAIVKPHNGLILMIQLKKIHQNR